MKKVILNISIALFAVLDLIGAVPTWSVTPADFSNSMTMVGVLNLSGVESLDENDLVAAFIDGQVRGVANVQYESASDRYIAYLIIYGNESSGDITFKLYDADADLELDAYNTADFVINSVTGNLARPYIWSNLALNANAEFLTFSFPESSMASAIGTESITVSLASGTDVSALTATFNTSSGATIWINGTPQTSGLSVNDFSAPVNYLVIAEDGQQSSTYSVTATATNNPPTDISLSSSDIAENNLENAVVGTLTATDDDTGHSFALVIGSGDTDNDLFQIVGDEFQVISSLDFETTSSFEVRVQITDGGGQTFEESLAITVLDVNESPTDIVLANAELSEHTAKGNVVGGLSATDEDDGDTFTYSLTGSSADNAFFAIDGSEVTTDSTFNYETQSSFSIQVLVTDAGSNSYEETIVIAISDANDAPMNFSLDNQTVFENLPFGTVIGTFSVTDEDASDTHSYSLVSGTGATANSAVLVSGTQLLLNSTQDFETQDQLSIRLKVEDGQSESFEKNFVITILDANDSPTDISLSSSDIAENNLENAVIGTLTATDDDTAHSFALVIGSGDKDNDLFQIVGDEFQVISSLDFETASSFDVRVQVTDEGGQTFEESLAITVLDVNESPTDIVLDNPELSEHTAKGAVVGGLSTTDVDHGDTFIYSLTGSSADNAFFAIEGSEVTTTSTFNYETQSNFSIQVLVTDAGSNSYEETIVIAISDANDAPTNFSLDNQTVFENLPFGTVIGTFSVTDEDASDTHSYSLVSGTGATANSAVLVSGTQLLLNSTQDFETQDQLSIRLKVEDGQSESFEKNFVITILDANDSPTDISLSSYHIDENNLENAVIGTLTATDDDTAHSFALVIGSGDTDNDLFQIVGDEFQVISSLDYETAHSFEVRVQVTDGGGQTFEESLAITVLDVNESPTDIVLDNPELSEHTAKGTVVGGLSATDEDEGDTFIYSLTGSSSDNAFFAIDGSEVTTDSTFNYETQSSFSIQVQVTDAGSNTYEETMVIAISDANDAPTDIRLDNQSVFENLPFGTVIGTLSVTDEDASDTHSFSLVSGTGDIDNALVIISGSQLLLKNSQDFETKSSLLIRVVVNDSQSDSIEKTFVIEVLDANDSPTELRLSNLTLMESDTIGFEIGDFSVVDADQTSTTFSFVNGLNDNDSFSIEEGALKTARVMDFESQNEFILDVLARDIDDQFIVNRFVVDVLNVNESPSDIVLSNTSINENIDQQKIIGTLSAIDQDAGDSHTFSLPIGIEDNDSFVIENNTLIGLDAFDFESIQSYLIHMNVTDVAGLTAVKAFTITIVDQNEAPMVVKAIGALEIAQGNDLELSLSEVFNDVDADDTLILSISVAGENSLPEGLVLDAENGSLRISASVVLEAFDIHLTATDAGGLTATDIISVTKNLVTGIDEGRSELMIYPNPTSHFLNISGSKASSFRVLNMFGKTILQSAVLNDRIDVSDLTPDVYVLRLVESNKVRLLKFIKD